MKFVYTTRQVPLVDGVVSVSDGLGGMDVESALWTVRRS
jgi:hypothetical protein